MTTDVEKRLWKRVNRYLRFLQVIPFVKMVAVCNNLAFGKADEKSDIDLFIVAKKGRLFIVRSLVTVLLQVLGVRRHGDKVAGRFCLSFFIDESAIDLSKIALEDDIYLAYWIRSMVVVSDSVDELGEDFSEGFLAANGWIETFFHENELLEMNYRLIQKDWLLFPVKVLVSLPFFSFWGNLVERFLKSWQLNRAKKKAAKVVKPDGLIVKPNILKFHNIDRRREYGLRWREKYGDTKLSRLKFLNL